MPSVSLSSLLAFGFVLGLRHALDADHLVAVSTIVTERRTLVSASLIGASWGLGHTLALLIIGTTVMLLQYHMSNRLTHVLELGVGMMLVLLGANVLRAIVRDGHHVHRHTPGRRHSHAHLRLVRRPLLVGMVHGLAGSAPLSLVILTVVSSPLAGLSYLAVFGTGSVMGMTMITTLVSVPAQLTAARYARAYVALRSVSAVFSVGLGLFIVYDNGALRHLFR